MILSCPFVVCPPDMIIYVDGIVSFHPLVCDVGGREIVAFIRLTDSPNILQILINSQNSHHETSRTLLRTRFLPTYKSTTK